MPPTSNVAQVLKQMLLELDYLSYETHPVYVSLMNTLEATKVRLLSLAELQFYQEVAFADKTLHVSRQTVDNDYDLGLTDAYYAVAGDIYRRKAELAQILIRLGYTKYVDELSTIDLK